MGFCPAGLDHLLPPRWRSTQYMINHAFDPTVPTQATDTILRSIASIPAVRSSLEPGLSFGAWGLDADHDLQFSYTGTDSNTISTEGTDGKSLHTPPQWTQMYSRPL